MASYKDFKPVVPELFFQKFDGDNYAWVTDWPTDIDWQEAHNDFVIDNITGETVGYRRTSSWGAPDEYYIIEKLLKKRV